MTVLQYFLVILIFWKWLSVIPNLTATSISHVPGRNVMLSFDDDISGALQKVCDNLM